jgi:epoxyqueuosine reductase
MPLPLSTRIKHKARQLGFDLCRIIPVGEAPHFDFLTAWLERGNAGEMAYLLRNQDKRRHPATLASANQHRLRTMIVLAVDYSQVELPAEILADPSRGIIAAYARGEDYHELIRPLLYELDAFIAAESGRSVPGKCLVDSAPLLERDWAQLAGIGFIGKNCCVIHPRLGSCLLLASVLVPEEIDYDQLQPLESIILPTESLTAGLPWTGDYGRWQIPEMDGDGAAPGACGRCSRCLAACPTGAFVGPYHLDPRRCISYWTIEAKGGIPRELRPLFGNRIFGCDICQDVCPWNRRRGANQPGIPGLAAREEQSAPALLEGFAEADPYWLVEEAFATRFSNTPILRPGRNGMLRNVCVALGNWGSPQALPALARALENGSPLVRAHAAWAVGEVMRKNRGLVQAVELLEVSLDVEEEQTVTEEIRLALRRGSW